MLRGFRFALIENIGTPVFFHPNGRFDSGIGKNGEALNASGQGAPAIGFSYIADSDLSSFHLVSGHAPRTRDQIVIDQKTADKTKYEAVDIFRKFDIPCAPVLSMKELLHDKSLRASGSIVEVPHKVRGSYWTVGSPIKFSDTKPEVTASPLLGEHTDEVLAQLGYSSAQIAEMHKAGAV